MTLTRQSTTRDIGPRGPDPSNPPDPSSQALIASLAKLHKVPADLRIATAYDDSQSSDLQLFAFKVSGVAGPALGQAIVDSYVAAADPRPDDREEDHLRQGGHPGHVQRRRRATTTCTCTTTSSSMWPRRDAASAIQALAALP